MVVRCLRQNMRHIRFHFALNAVAEFEHMQDALSVRVKVPVGLQVGCGQTHVFRCDISQPETSVR